MKGIRTAIIFLFGETYASSIWTICLFAKTEEPVLFVPFLFAFFSTIIILVTTIFYIAEHWKDE